LNVTVKAGFRENSVYSTYTRVVASNDILSYLLSVLYIIVSVLSILHAFRGRYRNVWLVSVIAMVLVYQLDKWERMDSSFEFCEKYVRDNCVRNSKGEIDCPNKTFRCVDAAGEDFKF